MDKQNALQEDVFIARNVLETVLSLDFNGAGTAAQSEGTERSNSVCPSGGNLAIDRALSILPLLADDRDAAGEVAAELRVHPSGRLG